jgi:hypothetical protein
MEEFAGAFDDIDITNRILIYDVDCSAKYYFNGYDVPVISFDDSPAVYRSTKTEMVARTFAEKFPEKHIVNLALPELLTKLSKDHVIDITWTKGGTEGQLLCVGGTESPSIPLQKIAIGGAGMLIPLLIESKMYVLVHMDLSYKSDYSGLERRLMFSAPAVGLREQETPSMAARRAVKTEAGIEVPESLKLSVGCLCLEANARKNGQLVQIRGGDMTRLLNASNIWIGFYAPLNSLIVPQTIPICDDPDKLSLDKDIKTGPIILPFAWLLDLYTKKRSFDDSRDGLIGLVLNAGKALKSGNAAVESVDVSIIPGIEIWY